MFEFGKVAIHYAEQYKVEILRWPLAGLSGTLWYTVNTTSSYEYNNLQAATNLNEVEYILLAGGIMLKKGDTIM